MGAKLKRSRNALLSKRAPLQNVPPNCRSIRDGDEWYCPQGGCGVRWEVGTLRPDCPLKRK